MKYLLFYIIGFLLMSVHAFAAEPATRYYTIDLTGGNFASESFNLFDDNLPGFDAVAIRVDGLIDDDFTVSATASNPDDTCDVKVLKVVRGDTILRLIGSPEVDSGDTCTLQFKNSAGKKADLEISAEGT